jgi:hypothetical protein
MLELLYAGDGKTADQGDGHAEKLGARAVPRFF